MPDSASPSSTSKSTSRMPPLAPGQKIFLRISGVIAMVLFLLPTFYVVKYFAIDNPREGKLVANERTAIRTGMRMARPITISADEIPMMTEAARHGVSSDDRVTAIRLLGNELQKMSVNFERPMECLQAKSTIADLAANDPDATVRSTAQDVIGKIAQGGAILRR